MINYRATPQWDDEVRRLTAGIGVDNVLAVGGAATFAHSLAAVRLGGSINVIGFVGGMDGQKMRLVPASSLMEIVSALSRRPKSSSDL